MLPDLKGLSGPEKEACLEYFKAMQKAINLAPLPCSEATLNSKPRGWKAIQKAKARWLLARGWEWLGEGEPEFGKGMFGHGDSCYDTRESYKPSYVRVMVIPPEMAADFQELNRRVLPALELGSIKKPSLFKREWPQGVKPRPKRELKEWIERFSREPGDKRPVRFAGETDEVYRLRCRFAEFSVYWLAGELEDWLHLGEELKAAYAAYRNRLRDLSFWEKRLEMAASAEDRDEVLNWMRCVKQDLEELWHRIQELREERRALFGRAKTRKREELPGGKLSEFRPVTLPKATWPKRWTAQPFAL